MPPTRNSTYIRILSAILLCGLFVLYAPRAAAQGGAPGRPSPADLAHLMLADPVSAPAKISPQIADAVGRVAVVVRLSRSPASQAPNQPAQAAAVSAEQDAVIARVGQVDPSARVIGRTRILLNAVILDIDAARLSDLALDVRVAAINPVVDFALDQSAALPYIGATPGVQRAASGGAGVRVAVLDSGIDYTHAAFGGPGSAEAYAAAYGAGPSDPANTTLDGLFPTDKVVGGYDFVGERWPDGPLAPDPDPIDYEGHGTHVADIIGGRQGVAPGASLYAVKVCSAVSSACSGAAILQGMEYAADPNGDGKTNDHVDIVNMSLGSAYGDAYFDDLARAVESASKLGILTVASAGNNADRPYIVGTPAVAPSALAVAQTQMPGAKAYTLVINGPASVAGQYKNTASVDWAPIGAGFSGDVVYAGYACPGDPLPAGLAGKVALVDRDNCAASLKTDQVAAAGAVGVLIGMSSPDDPIPFSFGGGDRQVPTLIITQSAANLIKLSPSGPVHVTVSDAAAVALEGSMVGSSSRGPAIGRAFTPMQQGYWFNERIKPEIGAPGAAVSAVAGSGDGSAAFSGTSGAAPMVAGAAALLLTSDPGLSPGELKARLMNTAETTIYANPVTQPGVLAPISRIGGGEVRVDRAIAAGATAFDVLNRSGALSFGFIDVSHKVVPLCRTVEVKSTSDQTITYGIGSSFRYADDAANGAVTLHFSRQSLILPPGRARFVLVCMEIDGAKLRPWTLNSGSQGGDAGELTRLEYDGYITFSDLDNPDNTLHMAWHVLPRLSPLVRATELSSGDDARPERDDAARGDGLGQPAGRLGSFTLKNRGVGDGSYQVLSLIGENPTPPRPGEAGSLAPNITARYLGMATYPVSTTICTSGLLAQFGVQTWQPVSHANYPLEIDIALDLDRDGSDDYLAYTAELNGDTAFAGDGRNAVYAGPVNGTATARFFTQHGTHSGAFILNACGENLGLTSADAGRLIDVHAYTFDNYFTGEMTSHIMATTSVLSERYAATDPASGTALGTLSLPAGSRVSFDLSDAGARSASTESGLLLLNVAGGASEAIVVRAPRCAKGDQSYDSRGVGCRR